VSQFLVRCLPDPLGTSWCSAAQFHPAIVT
jgi:hypothetical protein